MLIKILTFQSVAIIFCCLVLLWLPTPLTLAQTCNNSNRADGLISAPSFGGTDTLFGSSVDACAIGNNISYYPFQIDTYQELLAKYYSGPRSYPTSDPRQPPMVGDVDAAILNFNSDTVLNIRGNLTFTTTPAGNRTAVIFVDESVSIQGNIEYGENASGDLPYGLVLVVRNNVYISPAVTKINAVIISTGIICTSTEGSGATESCPTAKVDPPTGANTKLVINGSLISLDPTPQNSSLRLRRNLVNNAIAAEEVKLNPKYFVILKDLFSDPLRIESEVY